MNASIRKYVMIEYEEDDEEPYQEFYAKCQSSTFFQKC